MKNSIDTKVSLADSMEAGALITPTQFAELTGADPKSVRRLMRTMTAKDSQPGSGNRWGLDADAVRALELRIAASHNRKVVVFKPLA